MPEASSKNDILKSIREALQTPAPLPFPGLEASTVHDVFPGESTDPALEFAEAFTKVGGKFIYCESLQALPHVLKQLLQDEKLEKVFYQDEFVGQLLQEDSFPSLADSDVSVTGCECLVARTGTMVLASNTPGGRSASIYAPVHICIAFMPQLVYDISNALAMLTNRYGPHLPSSISFATGPSRTADIEKTLVTGVHGPKVVYCILTETNQ